MRREEFIGLFLGFLIKKSDEWLPEESTEENMLDVMQKRLSEHNYEIKKVISKYERNNATAGSNS